MTQTARYHGGLVFTGQQESALDRFSRIVSATLEDYGHRVERQSIMSVQQARITASQFLVKLTLSKGAKPSDHTTRSMRIDAAAGLNPKTRVADEPMQRLEISLCPADPARADQSQSELLLVVMMYRMAEAYPTEYVEWLSPETILTTEQFLGAFSTVSPRRVRSRQQILDCKGPRFAPVDDTEPGLVHQYDAIAGQKLFDGHEGPVSLSEQEALSFAFRMDPHPDEFEAVEEEDERDNDIRRLASWGMTGMMVFISAPVAISMAAVNLAKGEDFRLNTNVLSLTGCLVVLQSSGALASVMAMLPL